MIKGVGTDIEEIGRIAELIKNNSFLNKCFLPSEISKCSAKRYPPQHFAARFCAKEAFAKACGKPQSWHDAEITNDILGAPKIILHGKAAEELKNCIIHLSVSHSREYANAVVIIEEK